MHSLWSSGGESNPLSGFTPLIDEFDIFYLFIKSLGFQIPLWIDEFFITCQKRTTLCFQSDSHRSGEDTNQLLLLPHSTTMKWGRGKLATITWRSFILGHQKAFKNYYDASKSKINCFSMKCWEKWQLLRTENYLYNWTKSFTWVVTEPCEYVNYDLICRRNHASIPNFKKGIEWWNR